MTKKQFTEKMAAKISGGSTRQALRWTDAFLVALKDALVAGESIQIRGFGEISTALSAAKSGRDNAIEKALKKAQEAQEAKEKASKEEAEKKTAEEAARAAEIAKNNEIPDWYKNEVADAAKRAEEARRSHEEEVKGYKALIEEMRKAQEESQMNFAKSIQELMGKNSEL